MEVYMCKPGFYLRGTWLERDNCTHTDIYFSVPVGLSYQTVSSLRAKILKIVEAHFGHPPMLTFHTNNDSFHWLHVSCVLVTVLKTQIHLMSCPVSIRMISISWMQKVRFSMIKWPARTRSVFFPELCALTVTCGLSTHVCLINNMKPLILLHEII